MSTNSRGKATTGIAAPTVGSAQIGYGSTTASATNCDVAFPGSAGIVSATACIVVNVAGTTGYIPYF